MSRHRPNYFPDIKRLGTFCATFHPAQGIRARNVSLSNQCLSLCVGKRRHRLSAFSLANCSLSCIKRFGKAKSPSCFGISYSSIRWSRNVFHVKSEISRWSWWRTFPGAVPGSRQELAWSPGASPLSEKSPSCPSR